MDNPQLVAFSASALDLVDVDAEETKQTKFVEYFGGNKILPGIYDDDNLLHYK